MWGGLSKSIEEEGMRKHAGSLSVSVSLLRMSKGRDCGKRGGVDSKKKKLWDR